MGHQNIKLAVQFDKVIAVNRLMADDFGFEGANLGFEGVRLLFDLPVEGVDLGVESAGLLIDLPVEGVDLGVGARYRPVERGAGAVRSRTRCRLSRSWRWCAPRPLRFWRPGPSRRLPALRGPRLASHVSSAARPCFPARLRWLLHSIVAQANLRQNSKDAGLRGAARAVS